METLVASTDQRKLAEPGIDDEDRLSSLPDEVLSHILSLLQTKYAVGTAVLSRRWKNLWTRVSNLDLDYLLVYNPVRCYQELLDMQYTAEQLAAEDRRDREVKGRRDVEFPRFVERVLSRHTNLNSLRRFRIDLPMEFLITCREVSSNFWCKMELASWSQLEEVDVELEWDDQLGPRSHMHWIPECFYSLQNLKVLKLVEVNVATGHCSVFLPSVKTMELLRVEIVEFESLGRLLSGCPVLETASMEYCYFSNRNENYVLVASLPSLKKLKIFSRSDARLCPIAIEAPSLEQLYLQFVEEFQFLGSSPLSCLVLAWVSIRWSHSSDHSLTGFLNQIAHAKEMCLVWQTLSLLMSSDVQLPVFAKLTHLTIQLAGSSRVLHSLLKSAPKLNSLMILLEDYKGVMEWGVWEPACAPACLLSCLEKITIDNLKVDEDEMKMVAYLLKAGAVLKQVNIICTLEGEVDPKDRKVLVSLLKLPRGSSTCKARLFLSNEWIHINSDDSNDAVSDMVKDDFDDVFYDMDDDDEDDFDDVFYDMDNEDDFDDEDDIRLDGRR